MPKSAPPRKTQSAAKQAARRASPSAPSTTATPTLVVDGTAYPLSRDDLTPLDVVALRKATGNGLAQLSMAMVDGRADVDLIAAWMWLSRRTNGEPGLPFEVVAVELGMDPDVIFDAPATPGRDPGTEDGLPEA